MELKAKSEIMEIIKGHLVCAANMQGNSLPGLAAKIGIKASTLRALYYDVTSSMTLETFIKLINYFDIAEEIISDNTQKTDAQSTGMEQTD